MSGYFGADLITAFADAGAENGADVGGIATEIGAHFFDGVNDNAGVGSAPTGMHGGDGAFGRVEQKDGDAIGSADADAAVGIIGDESITFVLPVGKRMGVPNLRGMDLAQSDVHRRVCHAGAKAVALPEEMLKLGATVNAVVAEQER